MLDRVRSRHPGQHVVPVTTQVARTAHHGVAAVEHHGGHDRGEQGHDADAEAHEGRGGQHGRGDQRDDQTDEDDHGGRDRGRGSLEVEQLGDLGDGHAPAVRRVALVGLLR